jgi:hypothetical protein
MNGRKSRAIRKYAYRLAKEMGMDFAIINPEGVVSRPVSKFSGLLQRSGGQRYNPLKNLTRRIKKQYGNTN